MEHVPQGGSITRESPSRVRLAAVRVACLVTALLFSAGAAETALRLAGYGRSYFSPFATFHENDDLIGIRGRANFTGRLRNGEIDALISNDEHGFRRPASFPQPKAHGPKIFVLGDSYFWGWGVGQGDVVTDLIQQRLPNHRVRNLAVSATGTVQQYAIFEKLVLPDLRRGETVLLGFYGGNDFGDNLGRNHPGRLHATIADGRIQLVPADGTACSTSFTQTLKDNSYLLNLVIYSWNRLRHRSQVPSQSDPDPRSITMDEGSGAASRGKPYADDSAEARVASYFLERFKIECEKRGAFFKAVYIPFRAEFGEDCPENNFLSPSRERRTFLRCAATLGIEVIDLVPRFRAAKAETPGKRLSYVNDFHWNAAGHRLVADVLCESLRSAARLSEVPPAPRMAGRPLSSQSEPR